MIESKEYMQSIKDKNFNIVCEYMKSNIDMTVNMVSKASGFSLPTVAKILNYGVEIGVFKKSNKVSTGGRKAQWYCLNSRFSHTVFFAVESEYVKWRVCDFSDNVVKSGSCSVLPNETNEYVMTTLEMLINKYKTLNLCAVSMPCVLEKGVIMDWGKNPEAMGINLHDEIMNRFGIDSVIENDMKILAMGAYKIVGSGTDGAVMSFYISDSLYGMGTVFNGKILSGKNGFAGEVSYIPFDIPKDRTELSVKMIASAIALVSPSVIVLYSQCNEDIVTNVVSRIKKIIPRYALPEFVTGVDFSEDIFLGLGTVTADYKKITGCI